MRISAVHRFHRDDVKLGHDRAWTDKARPVSKHPRSREDEDGIGEREGRLS